MQSSRMRTLTCPVLTVSLPFLTQTLRDPSRQASQEMLLQNVLDFSFVATTLLLSGIVLGLLHSQWRLPPWLHWPSML